LRALIVSSHSLILCVLPWLSCAALAQPVPSGPLRVSTDNPRYFDNADGDVVLLTGSHVWYNLVDMGPSDPPGPFDYDRYVEWMSRYNHNFMRMWRWDLIQWRWQQVDALVGPHPWPRTGPGKDLHGEPRFDLNQLNDAYFTRLRARVEKARQNGIYVSIMLFEGWGLQFSKDGWRAHPFHPGNNVNNTGVAVDADGNGLDIYTLEHESITALQEAYVKRLVDTVNDLDNVLYEISNENHPGSTQWQYHMIRLIDEYERSKPKQHPIGMTFQYNGGNNQSLFESPANWISPNPEGGYRDNPPINDGSKIILSDTDHLWGLGGNQAWVWKSFLRGLNPIFMDPYDGQLLDEPFNPKWEGIRKSMGYVRQFADQIDLKRMVPSRKAASSGFCLLDPGREYLIYLPAGGEVKIQVGDLVRSFDVVWFNPNSGVRKNDAPSASSTKWVLTSPFGTADCVLHLKSRPTDDQRGG
jgi:uncharacterized protein DUF6298/collagenase-like protein with putative collagen-binding domain